MAHQSEPDVDTQVAQHGAGMTVVDWARLLRCTESGSGMPVSLYVVRTLGTAGLFLLPPARQQLAYRFDPAVGIPIRSQGRIRADGEMSPGDKIRVIGDGKSYCGLRIACQGRAGEKEPRRGHIGPPQEGVSTKHERCYLRHRYR
jgi:hypothetical protein